MHHELNNMVLLHLIMEFPSSPAFYPISSVWFVLIIHEFYVVQVKIAIVGITAGGVGLDFSSATHVVFLELPQSPSLMLQV